MNSSTIMNWRAIIQYLGLVGVNCAQIRTASQLIASKELAALAGLSMVSLTWAAYVELAVGGVIVRPDIQNKSTFQPTHIIQQVRWPLTDRHAWRPDFWDLNYYMVLAGTTAGYTTWRHLT